METKCDFCLKATPKEQLSSMAGGFYWCEHCFANHYEHDGADELHCDICGDIDARWDALPEEMKR